MFRISKLADYGTLVMVHLARQGSQLLNAKEIADHVHLPSPTVAKLLKKLTSAKLLKSTRGVKGGYCLMDTADRISVAQIIRAVDGETGLTECSVASAHCQLESVCVVRGNWQLINNAVQETLANIRLTDLAKPNLTQVEIMVDQVTRKNDQQATN